MLSELLKWKNNVRDWEQGKSLYLKLGTNAGLKYLLAKPKTQLSEQLLLKEVNVLIEKYSWEASEKTLKHKKKEVTPEALPEVKYTTDVNELIENRKKLYKEAGIAHSKLRSIVKDEERFTLARLIVHNMKQNNKLWAAQEYFERNGHLPPDTSEQPVLDAESLSLNDLMKLRTSLPPNISRDRKTLQNCKDEDKIKFLKTRIETRQQLLEAVKIKIANAVITA